MDVKSFTLVDGTIDWFAKICLMSLFSLAPSSTLSAIGWFTSPVAVKTINLLNKPNISSKAVDIVLIAKMASN